MNCGFMIKFIYEQYLNLLWILLFMIGYLCKSLRIISLAWPTGLIFLAMGEVLSVGVKTGGSRVGGPDLCVLG